MKQKIVIKLEMDCDKCRNKALKIAAEVPGVTAVSLEGDEKDCVAVTGDNVNMVCLANQLKKKFRSVIILSVEDLTKKAAEEKKKKEEEAKKKKEEEEKKKLEEEIKKKLCCVCHGKCQKPKCDVIICVKCESPKCQCKCNNKNKEFSKCENPECDGHACVKICFKCESPKCKGQCKPPSPCYHPCPQWCTCLKCYVPYPYPCQVVYDSYSCPDNNCAIM